MNAKELRTKDVAALEKELQELQKRILCNVHSNMEAFIVVKEHPYFAAAERSGNYRLNGVPVGKYRLQVWHPQLGTPEANVEIGREGEVLDINFHLKKK